VYRAPVPSRATTALAIALAIAVGLAARLHAWTGLIASDDLTHAWAATHLWSQPIEPDMPGSVYTVNARRVGVNLPLAAAAAVTGGSETGFAVATLLESLAAIAALALWAGALAGRRAAVIAAWLAALSPIDAWMATVWLQDALWTLGLALAMAAAAWGARTGARRWWLVAGFVFGYLQYVKESAAILLVVLIGLGAWRSWRARALDRGAIALVLGAAIAHGLAALYWWIAMDDPTYYVRAWLERQTSLEAAPAARPFPHNLVRLGLYVGYHGALGLGLPIAGYFAVRWLRRGDAPARVRVDVAAIAIVQVLLLVHVLRWGAWTQRYLMQVTPLLIAVGAAGLATAWPGARARTRDLRVAAIVAATGLGLALGQPQHGPHRAAVLRQGLAAIAAAAPADAPVYVVLGPRPAHYADRAFRLLDRAGAARYRTTDAPAAIDRGFVVWTHLERHPTRPTAPPGRRVFAATTGGGLQWIEVYAVGLP
jgi:4-amino-4-deoxy-L-arabinose transferase-like glycosyltransferase